MGDYKVYLGNIPDDTRDRDVEKLFKSYGRIRNVVIKVGVLGEYSFSILYPFNCRGTSKELTDFVSLMI